MIEKEILKLYRKRINKNLILSFKGSISQDILVELGETIKNKFSCKIGQKKISKKVFAIFIELAQNILHHSAEKISLENEDKKIGTGIIDISENKHFYTITSGNLVENSKSKKILNKCNYINQLDKEGLKKYYLEQRKLPRTKESQSAGLGLIDIARKSGNILEAKINKIDDLYSFFILSVDVSKENNNE